MADRVRTLDVVNDDTRGTAFKHMGLKAEVKQGLAAAGYESPTPIQLKAVPIGLLGADMVVKSKAGTGKTLIFALLVLESVDTNSSLPQSITLTATREIALQIAGVVAKVGAFLPKLQVHTFIGGTSKAEDKASLRCCQAVVGSAGRLHDLVCESSLLYTGKIRQLFIDEVDALFLSSDTAAHINSIFRALPERKQVCTFSATYTPALEERLATYMRTPRVVEIADPKVSLRGVTEYVKVIDSSAARAEQVVRVLNTLPFTQCIVFLNDFEESQELARRLCGVGIAADCICGRLEQRERTQTIKRFAAFAVRVLVSSDLTSRGIDMTKVNLVLSLDVPAGGETYMHRIGRTGRYGSLGVSIALVGKADHGRLLACRREVQADSELRALPEDLGTIPTDYMKGVLAGTEELRQYEQFEAARVQQDSVKVPRSARRVLAKGKADGSDGDSDGDSSTGDDDDDSGSRSGGEGEGESGAAKRGGDEGSTGSGGVAKKRRLAEPPVAGAAAVAAGATTTPQQGHLLPGFGFPQEQVPLPQQPQMQPPYPTFPQCPPPAPVSYSAAPQSSAGTGDPNSTVAQWHQRLNEYYSSYYRSYYAVASECMMNIAQLRGGGR